MVMSGEEGESEAETETTHPCSDVPYLAWRTVRYKKLQCHEIFYIFFMNRTHLGSWPIAKNVVAEKIRFREDIWYLI